MATPVETLQRARETMVKARRDVSEALSKPYDGRTTPQARASFIEIQNVIDQIDKAIADENGAGSNFNKPINYPKSPSA